MEDRQISALTEMMNAVNAGDAARYASVYMEDAVITIYGGGELMGRGAIEQYEIELLREFPGTRLALRSIWQEGASAVVHYAVNGQTASRQWMGHEGLLFYKFHPSGLIETERRYLDSLTPMAQLGMLDRSPARELPTLPNEPTVHVARGVADEKANVEIVRATFAALDSANELEFLAAMAADAVADELVYPHPFIGRGNVKAWFEAWTKAVTDATTEINTILGVGAFVLVETVVSGTLNGPLGRVSASNKPFAVHRAAIFQLENEKVIRVTGFLNGKELAEAVGQWPPPLGSSRSESSAR